MHVPVNRLHPRKSRMVGLKKIIYLCRKVNGIKCVSVNGRGGQQGGRNNFAHNNQIMSGTADFVSRYTFQKKRVEWSRIKNKRKRKKY